MPRRPWTFVIVSDDPQGARQIRLSRDAMRALIAIVLLVVGGFSSAATRFYNHTGRLYEEHQLARKNVMLEAELAGMRAQLDTLRGSLDELAGKDEYFRLLAGLDPLDAEIKQVGAGPGTATLIRHPLYRVDRRTAERAFSASSELNDLLRRARLLTFSWREAKDSVQWKYEQLAGTPSILPTAGYISSSFSHRRIHPILSRPRPHLGLDIVAPRGTPIVATARGVVRFVGTAGEYGLTIEIDHGNRVVTRYAHASRSLVRRGQPVERGDIIAHVGDTGLAVGPHLHYEVLVNDRQANPRRFILDMASIPD